jgi:hypothetical protein
MPPNIPNAPVAAPNPKRFSSERLPFIVSSIFVLFFIRPAWINFMVLKF